MDCQKRLFHSTLEDALPKTWGVKIEGGMAPIWAVGEEEGKGRAKVEKLGGGM